MSGFVLVLNAGSSSLKFSIFERADTDGWKTAANGRIESIGTNARFTATDGAGKVLLEQTAPELRDGHAALDALLQWLRMTYARARVLAVGHRVVHGGSHYAAPALVTDQVLQDLHALEPLAPLHQPHNLAAIEACAERLPGVTQVACFDTSFHRGQPPVAKLVPLPREIRCRGIQRYGFHGLSYEYIAHVLPQVAPDIAGGNVIVAHLGSGASLCALRNGQSLDCSMGFTALDGLCMATRPGAVDSGVILYLFQTLGLSAQEVETMLYKESGLLGISGISNDMRNLLASDAPEARLAVDYFVYRASKEIGAFAAVLGGADAVVFTAGIGEHSAEIRQRICAASAWLGIDLDEAANARHGPCISTPDSQVSAWVVPTNEELMIVQHTGRLIG